MSGSGDPSSLSPQGRGTGAQGQGEGRAKNAGDLLKFAREARQHKTEAEERLWLRLRGRRLGVFKFRRQHVVGRARPDFICPSGGRIVEVDGSQHGPRVAQDGRRTTLLNDRGYRVLRVWNNDVLAGIDSVLQAILAELTAPHPARCASCPSPRRGEGD